MAAKTLSPEQVLDKMAKYCAYQERCIKDVKEKLKSFDIPQRDKDQILEYLIGNRFVNEERFTKSFVRGKINQSGWGINKIRFHLMQKGIDKALIDGALQLNDEEAYRQRLVDLLQTKAKTVKAETDYERQRKLAAFALQRGFEATLVWEVLRAFQVAQNENR